MSRQIGSDDDDDEQQQQMQNQRKGRAVIQSDDENENPTTPRRSSSKKSSKKQRHTANSDGEMYIDNEDDEPEVATPVPPTAASASVLSSNRSKKRRIVRADNEDDENNDNEDLQNSEKKPDVKPKPQKALVRDPKDGFVMGSVVRIQCHDFLTYNDIECMPGPHLNIIFGPNGSGKSSLAGAIAIGLGFPPKVVGRQKELSGYVRRGCKDGWVEIELKGKPGKRNRVVRRELNSSNNSSKFFLDGNNCTKADVLEAVLELHVNVDNLCSFLPQDRVAAFAAMSGPEILKETQRVVNPKLIDQQEQLAEFKQQLDKASSALEKNAASLGEKERKVASMEKDVRRHKQKKEMEDAVEILTRLHPFAEYVELKDKVDELKKLRNQAKERVDELKDENAPMVERRDALQARAVAADNRKKAIGEERSKRDREHNSLVKKLQASDAELEKLRDESNQLKTQEEQRQNEMRGAQKEIERLQKLLNKDEGPLDPDAPELLQRSAEATAKLRESHAKIQEIASKNQEIENDQNRIATEKRRLQQQLAGLDDVVKRREVACQRTDQALWTATQWIREHRGEFADTVYDPIRLQISVKDKRHAKVAEAAISYATMKTIICLDPTDYRKLSDTFTKFSQGQGQQRDLRMNIAELPHDKRTLAAYPKPMSPEQLNQWGFDCFAIDLIEGPEHILAYLCEAQNLHQVPIALDDGQRIRQEALVRPNTPFRKYISRQHVTSITVSRYGQNKCIAQDQQTKEPNIFVETVDQNRKRELELGLADMDAQRATLQTQRDAILAQDAELRPRHQELQAEQKAIKDEREQRRKAQLAIEKEKVNLRNTQHRLQVLKAKPSEEAARRRIIEKMKKLTTDRLKQAGKLGILLRAIVEAQNAETVIVFAGIQANINFKRAEADVNNANKEMQDAKAVYDAAKERFGVIMARAKTVYAQANEGKASLPERLLPAFDKQLDNLTTEGTSSEAIQAETAAKQAELALIANVSHSIIEKYEHLSAEVESLRKELDSQETTVNRTKKQIERIHGKWYPEVQRIAKTVGERFAQNMEDMGCLGEVDIAEEDDYAKWAINIKVAFRDKESVQALTSHRQSGGEKSLSTMLYLISLLELSKVPFSLVDEINQGMDQRAERAVHNQLVHAVCERDDVGQYFLITPKLLTNLNYHEKIKVLCVNNGDWLPEELPLRKLIGRKLKSKQQNRK